MATSYEFTKLVDGIQFDYDRCEHCGGLPTDQDILDQVSRIKKEYGALCAVCGEKQKVTAAILRHHKRKGIDLWDAESILVERLLGVTIGQTDISLHEKCAKDALPYSGLGKKKCIQCGHVFGNGEKLIFEMKAERPVCVRCDEENEKIALT